MISKVVAHIHLFNFAILQQQLCSHISGWSNVQLCNHFIALAKYRWCEVSQQKSAGILIKSLNDFKMNQSCRTQIWNKLPTTVTMSPVICKSIIIFEICVFYSINLVNVLHNLLKTVHTPYKELDGEQLSVTYAPPVSYTHLTLPTILRV